MSSALLKIGAQAGWRVASYALRWRAHTRYSALQFTTSRWSRAACANWTRASLLAGRSRHVAVMTEHTGRAQKSQHSVGGLCCGCPAPPRRASPSAAEPCELRAEVRARWRRWHPRWCGTPARPVGAGQGVSAGAVRAMSASASRQGWAEPANWPWLPHGFSWEFLAFRDFGQRREVQNHGSRTVLVPTTMDHGGAW